MMEPVLGFVLGRHQASHVLIPSQEVHILSNTCSNHTDHTPREEFSDQDQDLSVSFTDKVGTPPVTASSKEEACGVGLQFVTRHTGFKIQTILQRCIADKPLESQFLTITRTQVILRSFECAKAVQLI